MNYSKLKLSLEQYGRNSHYAYVSDSFKPNLRQDKKYRQWKRLLDKVTLKAMSPNERAMLNAILDVSMMVKKEIFC